MAETGKDIHKAREILIKGDLVAIPTETVYGLAGNALNLDSVLKIFNTKNRPAFDPLIAHVDSVDKISAIATIDSDLVHALGEKFWPGPLTMLLPKKEIVPDILTSGLPRVAVRIPRHPLTLELLSTLDFPLAAPSANPFGYVSPTTAGHVNDQLGEKLDYILDGGPTSIGVESTIIGFDNEEIIVHRLGGLSLQEIKEFGTVRLDINQSSNPAAPGMLKSHYAPGPNVYLGNIDEMIKDHDPSRTGVISFVKAYPEVYRNAVLSPKADINEAARNLFGALRSMDDPKIDRILAEEVPDEGLGLAINDRLSRAAAK